MNARRLAPLLPGLLALVAAGLFDAAGSRFPAAALDVGIGGVYYLAGAVAYAARPDNRAARRLLAMVSAIAVAKGVGDGVSLALSASHSTPWLWAAIVVMNAVGWGIFVSAVALFAVFPDGVYQRLYERRLVVATVLVFFPVQLLQLLGSPRLAINSFGWGPMKAFNPVHLPGLTMLGRAGGAVFDLSPILLLAALALLVARYRRSGPEQRRQIRWPLFGVIVSAVLLVPQFVLAEPQLPFAVLAAAYIGGNAALPAALAIGIVRHRVLDIDTIIRRSAVYGVIWTVIAAGYVAVATGFGIAIGQRVPLAFAVVLTIVVTLVFQPARRTLERLADRFVFGPRLSGYELLTALGARLEASGATEDVAGGVAAAVQSGLGARWVRVMLNRPEPRPVAVIGIELQDPARGVLCAPLLHGEQAIGEIQCGPRRQSTYSAADQELLATLGRQAALAIRNSQLTAELSDRLEELAASRIRLVQAEETGRRRLERDLHDGVQQELVGLLARLGLARSQINRDVERAEATLREAQVDAKRALEGLQDLARGIHPAILTDRGLLEAVQERATRLTIPVEVTTDNLPSDARFGQAVEGAAYFVITEALTNVLKHAGAGHAAVHLAVIGRRLVIDIEDDGLGFDPGAKRGSGLRGLEDRLDALGGGLFLGAGARGGTLLHAELPLSPEQVHA